MHSKNDFITRYHFIFQTTVTLFSDIFSNNLVIVGFHAFRLCLVVAINHNVDKYCSFGLFGVDYVHLILAILMLNICFICISIF